MTKNDKFKNQQYNKIDNNFSEVKKACFEILKELGIEIVLKKDETLSQKYVYYLIEGICALCFFDNLGNESSLIYFRPGRLLNFFPCLSQFYPLHKMTRKREIPRRSFALCTKSNCRLLKIKTEYFLNSFSNNNSLQSLIIYSYTENMENLLSHAFNSPLLSAPQRVCKLLTELVNEEPPYVLPRSITYNEISIYLSLHIITVTKIFKKLREYNILSKYNNQIMILDMVTLRNIAEGLEEISYKKN